ncbi:hypothetical protein D3C84_1069270 [compost metagenome]
MRKLTSAPTSKVATKRIAQAAITRAEGNWMYGARCWDNAPPNIQAMAPATIQVSNDRASLTKPRLKLMRLETTMMPIIVQSTQVNATLRPRSGKGPAF